MIVLELRRAVYLAIIDEIDKSSKITKLFNVFKFTCKLMREQFSSNPLILEVRSSIFVQVYITLI